MAESTVSDKNASFEQKVHQAFLKAVDTIITSGKAIVTEILKAQENDCSTSVELQSHKVALGYSHASIRITPKGKEYKDDPRFKQVDELGRPYTTIGGGPEYNTLVSNLDRPKDIGPHPNRIPIGPKDCKEELVVIETLLAKDEQYKDNLDYDLFPKEEWKRSWSWADDSHNSNSYISGLIDAAGLKKPSIDTETHPGWDSPVPKECFGPHGHYLSKDHDWMQVDGLFKPKVFKLTPEEETMAIQLTPKKVEIPKEKIPEEILSQQKATSNITKRKQEERDNTTQRNLKFTGELMKHRYVPRSP